MATAPDRQPIVWIVWAEQWPRADLRAELIERGYHAVGFVSLEDALARLVKPGVAPPALLLIVLDGHPVSERQLALCARKQLKVALSGGKIALQAPSLQAFPAAAVLPFPITLGELASAVERLVPPAG